MGTDTILPPVVSASSASSVSTLLFAVGVLTAAGAWVNDASVSASNDARMSSPRLSGGNADGTGPLATSGAAGSGAAAGTGVGASRAASADALAGLRGQDFLCLVKSEALKQK